VDVIWIVLAVIAAVAIAAWFATVRVVKQVERGVVFRLGRAQPQLRRPGMTLLVPAVDRMTRVNVQVVTMPVPAQDGITRDNVTVRVDAVVYFKVDQPAEGCRRGAGLRVRDRPGCADVAALDHRQE
jgi:regulator of protease activity HflC (stomatin/prohibitin superfamily)